MYGELGRYPLSILVKVKQFKWWGKVLSSASKLVNIVYTIMIIMQSNNANCTFKLLKSVKDILQEMGFNYVWLSQNPGNINYLAMEIKLKLIVLLF